MKILLPIAMGAVAFSSLGAGTEIRQMLSPIEEKDGVVTCMPRKMSVAPAVAMREKESVVERLDSVVGFNSDGSKGTMQRFRYDGNGWWSATDYYYWDSSSSSWGDPVQSVTVDRMSNGYVLSERNIYMGAGVRTDYEYDSQNRGIIKINYFMNPGEDWVPTDKGEYEYDDRDNIIEEVVSVYDAANGRWDNVNHNFATWDNKGRQTSIDSYYWNGSDWERSMKVEYVWFDGPYDPDYIEGAEKERMSWRLEYMNFKGEWLPVFVTENFFNEDGRVCSQSYKYYNRKYDNYYGGDDYEGMVPLCDSWISEIGYDGKGIMNVSKTFKYIPGTEEKLYELGHCDFNREEKENGDIVVLETNRVNTFDEEWNVTGSNVIDMTWYAYNAAGKKLWCYEEMPSYDGTFIPMVEDKWAYDSDNNLIETVSYDFEGFDRVPNTWVSFAYDADGNQTEVTGRGNAAGGIKPLKPAKAASSVTGRDYRVGEDDLDENWEYTNHWTFRWENGVQTERLGYVWDGYDWMNSQGQNNVFDFSVTLKDMMVPEAYTDPYKIDYIEQLHGFGEDWLSTRMQYYYSEVVNSSVDGIVSGCGITLYSDIVSSGSGEAVSVNVYDISGKVVYSGEGVSVSLSGLDKGIYVVKAMCGDSSATFKISRR